jgi:NADH-dependent peroxiredoxin subunit F
METIFDLAIIGGGPAGVAGGVYAARKNIKTLFITENFQGQSTVSHEVQNWIDTPSISGAELSKNLENHLKSYADLIDIKEKERAISIVKNDDFFLIKTNKEEFKAKTILITTGSNHKKLPLAEAEKFEGRGIVYCATCDAPLFGGAKVAVIGGGNSAFEAVTQLLDYADNITIVQRSDFRAEKITIDKILLNPKVQALTNTELVKINGDKFVEGIIVKNRETGAETSLPVQGIFVEIGSEPNVSFVPETVKLDEQKHIIVNPKNQQTSEAGIWSAGDCTDGLYKQNNIAVGDAVKAVEDIYRFLKN